VQKAVWLLRHCWYCRRCGTVSLILPTLAATLHVTNLAANLVRLAARPDPHRT
jgi:hypothetical protein